MKTVYLFLFIFFLTPVCLISQNNNLIKNGQQANFNYFELPRETLFLHLNKSTYVLGENIWFKGYIYDRKEETPFKKTTNIEIGLYDANGKQILKNLYKGDNGYTHGHIPIDSSIVSGTYYVKASTNWMKNFIENDAFVQKIQIINKTVINPKNIEKQYDLQLMPEGGHIVTNLENTIGFKFLGENGYGEAFQKGFLLDPNKNIVTQFKSNSLGMGKFSFTPKPNTAYTVKIVRFNNEAIITNLDEINEKGILLNIKNYHPIKVLFSLKTNEQTIEEIRNKTYKLLISKDGKSLSSEFNFSKNDKEKIIIFNREGLFKGVNTVTVFDENENPILERLFFNHFGIEFPNAIVGFEKEEDSIQINIKIPSQLQHSQNLSISILPENTRAYNFKENIHSTFYLKPYVMGVIENPSYYFTDVTQEKLYDLDILLLTQGWARYKWHNIFNNTPTSNYKFEKGFTLSGQFNEPDLDRFPTFLIQASKFHNLDVIDLNSTKNFEFSNRFFETDEKIKIRLVKKNGATVIPKLATSVTPIIVEDSLDINKFKFTNITTQFPPNLDYKFDENATVLDTVELKDQVKKRKLFNSYVYASSDIIVDDLIIRKFFNVFDIIRARGFEVVDDGYGTFFIRNRRTNESPLIIIDGTRTIGTDLLIGLLTYDIERIVLQKSPDVFEGTRGANGVIRIWTRKSTVDLDIKGDNYRNQKTSLNIGKAFTPTKRYYSPKYEYTDPKFEHTGAIHWIPELIIEAKDKATFKIIDTGLFGVTFFIEGMAEDGALISYKQTIDLR